MRKLSLPLDSGTGRPSWAGWFCTGINRFRSVDQNWIQHRLITGDVDRITDFFNLVVAYNSGAAFSFLADAAGSVRFCRTCHRCELGDLRDHCPQQLPQISLSGSCSGSFRRARQRLGPIHYRCSRRLLDFHVGSYHWPAFNVADICICCGAGIVVLAEFFGKKN